MKSGFVISKGLGAIGDVDTAVISHTNVLASFIDIPMCNVNYFAMHIVQMHAGAITNMLYGFASLRAIIHELKLVDYLPVQTHTPYNQLTVICTTYVEYLLIRMKL